MNYIKKLIKNRQKLILAISVLIILVISIVIIIPKLATKTAASNEIGRAKFSEIASCFSKQGNEVQPCLDNFIINYAGTKSIQSLLAELELARTQNTLIENQCHPIAHSIGRYAFQKYNNVGDSFQACDQTCHAGCYHGVLERMFFNGDDISTVNRHVAINTLKQKIASTCTSANLINPTQPVIFQCFHGLGHAVMYTLDYDLQGSLATCDLLADNYQRSSCYGGVFMENVTAFDKNKRNIKTADPLYPCDSLAGKYQSDCYMMQTSIMSEFGMSSEQIAQKCSTVGQYAVSCFVSLGRDLSNYVRIDQPQNVITTCEDYSGSNSENCIDGTIYALIDNKFDPSFAFKFCGQLKKTADVNICYRDADSYLTWAYQWDKAKISQGCDQYASNNASICKQNI